MTTLPEPGVRLSTPEQTELDSEVFDGKREVEEFERLRDAYDPRIPVTGERMLRAFRKFEEIGYGAYFQGVLDVPALIAVRPFLAWMWKFGFEAAEFDAATRRCICDCDKRYTWGTGYGKCPRIPQRNQNK